MYHLNMKTKEKFDFSNLFVLDLANNHQGDLNHGIEIINQVSKIVKKCKVKSAIKFQFRNLDDFIHPNFKKIGKDQQVDRFLSTKLSINQFAKLFDCVKKNELIAMCTPFDEKSVDEIEEMGFDVIKVASCSANDWPLLEKVSKCNMPIIISTGGLLLSEIDDIVSFFDHKGCDFALMHCVSLYPTPDDQFNLDQIEVLRYRYKNIKVGFSTHEDPNNYLPIAIAVSKGAVMFEKHVGLETDNFKLNKYSSSPQQLQRWFETYLQAKKICGSSSIREISLEEKKSLNKLKRGVFLKNKVVSNNYLSDKNIYFAIPLQDGQLTSGEWKNKIKLKTSKSTNESILYSDIFMPQEDESQVIKKAIHEVKALLNKANVYLDSSFEVEYSHHYGVKNFNRYGAVLIDCINREYCKKIVVQLPGQVHPSHYHKLKEETFQLLYGDLTIDLDGKQKILSLGETCLVMPGVWHSFSSKSGCVFEEISTTHYNNDSVYKDENINLLKREERKTKVNHWGRYQIPTKFDK